MTRSDLPFRFPCALIAILAVAGCQSTPRNSYGTELERIADQIIGGSPSPDERERLFQRFVDLSCAPENREEADFLARILRDEDALSQDMLARYFFTHMQITVKGLHATSEGVSVDLYVDNPTRWEGLIYDDVPMGFEWIAIIVGDRRVELAEPKTMTVQDICFPHTGETAYVRFGDLEVPADLRGQPIVLEFGNPTWVDPRTGRAHDIAPGWRRATPPIAPVVIEPIDGDPDAFAQQLRAIAPGMSEAQVRVQLGAPNGVQELPDRDRWVYLIRKRFVTTEAVFDFQGGVLQQGQADRVTRSWDGNSYQSTSIPIAQ